MSSHPDSKIAVSTGRCPSTWSRVPGCRWGRAWQKDRWQWRAVTSDRRTGNQMAAKVNFSNNTSMKPWCAMCDVRQGGKIKNMCDVLCRLPFPSGVSIYACCKSVWVICLCWRLQRTPTQIAHMLVFFNDSEQVQFSKQHDGTPSSFGRHRRANLQWSRIWSNPPIWFRNFEIDMFSGACKLHLRCFPTLHRALVEFKHVSSSRSTMCKDCPAFWRHFSARSHMFQRLGCWGTGMALSASLMMTFVDTCLHTSQPASFSLPAAKTQIIPFFFMNATSGFVEPDMTLKNNKTNSWPNLHSFFQV